MAFERSAAGRTAPGTATAAGQPASHMHSGMTARQRSEAELAKQHERQERSGQGLNLNSVNRSRFWIGEGEQADIIILDASVDVAGYAYEHQWQVGTGRFSDRTGREIKEMVFEQCPKEYDNCCLCDQKGESGYVMYLTILDLRGFTKADGTFVPHFKRLMPIKTQLHPEFFKLSDAAVREFGTMRGMHLLMARDGTLNSAIGRPVMHPTGELFKMLSEEELQEEFGHDEIRDDAGGLSRMRDYDITAFAYTQLFPVPSGEDLRKRYGNGAGPAAGSRNDVDSEWRGTQQRQEGNVPGRTRTRVGGGMSQGGGQQSGQFRADDARTAPQGGQGGMPPRTRTRTAPSAAPAAQPASEAPAPVAQGARTRTRPAPAQPTGPAPDAAAGSRVRRSAAPSAQGRVANDLDDDIPFEA